MSEEHFNPLEYSCQQRIKNSGALLTLMIVEATARGVVPFTSLEEVRGRTGLSVRGFRRAVRDIVAHGAATVDATDDDVTFSFDGLSVSLAPLHADRRILDDPWQIIRAKVFAQKGSQCAYCGRDASQVDHIIPRSKGGDDSLSNLCPCCARCNVEKGARTPEEWRGAA